VASSKRDWLDCGLDILAEEGAQAIRLERLLASVGLTKGSFYHHFGGMPAYRKALAAYFEERYTSRYIDVATERSDDPVARLAVLRSLVAEEKESEVALEVAFRAWAQQDPDVRIVQARVDARRVEFLEQQLTGAGMGAHQALVIAQAIYLTLVGSGHVVPRLPVEAFERIWDMLLEPISARR
jgi:AcrR family transcriptional regulator